MNNNPKYRHPLKPACDVTPETIIIGANALAKLVYAASSIYGTDEDLHPIEGLGIIIDALCDLIDHANVGLAITNQNATHYFNPEEAWCDSNLLDWLSEHNGFLQIAFPLDAPSVPMLAPDGEEASI